MLFQPLLPLSRLCSNHGAIVQKTECAFPDAPRVRPPATCTPIMASQKCPLSHQFSHDLSGIRSRSSLLLQLHAGSEGTERVRGGWSVEFKFQGKLAHCPLKLVEVVRQ